MPLMLIHPETGATEFFCKGEGELAVKAYREGFVGLSDATTAKLKEVSDRMEALAQERNKRYTDQIRARLAARRRGL